MASCSVNTNNSNVVFIRNVHHRLKCKFVFILNRGVFVFNYDGFIFNISTFKKTYKIQGHGLYRHSNGTHIYFHQVQQLYNEENTGFQRNEHLEIHALALTQNFRKTLAQYIYLRSFLESLVKQLSCYPRGIDAVDSFHL